MILVADRKDINNFNCVIINIVKNSEFSHSQFPSSQKIIFHGLAVSNG
jgi:hypothetical protein